VEKISDGAIINCNDESCVKVVSILSRVLVTLDGDLEWLVDLLDLHQAEVQLVVTQSYCDYNTS
jgi:hypothetical protein